MAFKTDRRLGLEAKQLTEIKDPTKVGDSATVFDPEICKALVAARRKNLSMTRAAGLVGIGKTTVSYWLRRGQQMVEYQDEHGGELDAMGQFYLEWERAGAEAIKEALEKIEAYGAGGQVLKERYDRSGQLIERQVAPPTWQAYAWILERVHKDEFALTGPQQVGPQQHEVVIRYVHDWRGASSDEDADTPRQITDGEVVDGEFSED